MTDGYGMGHGRHSLLPPGLLTLCVYGITIVLQSYCHPWYPGTRLFVLEYLYVSKEQSRFTNRDRMRERENERILVSFLLDRQAKLSVGASPLGLRFY